MFLFRIRKLSSRYVSLSALLSLMYVFLLSPVLGDNLKSDVVNTGLEKAPVVVLYPDIPEPYRDIFTQIITGIKEQIGKHVDSRAVNRNTNGAELNAELKHNHVNTLIALGRQGLDVALGLDKDIAIVTGGILSIPMVENRTIVGISLMPDPMLLFNQLKSLVPGVKRVWVVYNPKHSNWLILRAKEAAKAQGLELKAQGVYDIASAARFYSSILSSLDGHKDALWLLQDATSVDENTLLPFILKESWDRGVAVISDSVPNVKRGALFALYPDNQAMGRTLGEEWLKVESGNVHQSGLLPLKDVLIAVNVRTASHIGLQISPQQSHAFNAVFPEP